MDQWTLLRQSARRQHDLLRREAPDDSASALLEAAERLTGIKRSPLAPDDPLLAGALAVLDREAGRVWYRRDLAAGLDLFYQAHEYAHFWLNHGNTVCHAEDVDAETPEEITAANPQRVEGYSARERRESQANVYARELLLPSDKLRRWFVEERQTANMIARRAGLAVNIVFQQLTDALLTPDVGRGVEYNAVNPPYNADLSHPGRVNNPPYSSGDNRLILDPSQAAAAEHLGRPLLIDAGPGTGKTRTLTGRVVFLLQAQHVAPEAILALTFSNKAAEEIRERVAGIVPAAAPHIWMGTFHAFGLELLRKYGEHLGLPPAPVVLDPPTALFVFETLLPKLNLRHYLNLYDPTLYFWDVLHAISRAKDELVGPERYRELAQAQLDQATTEDETVVAEKALEVAQMYRIYQEHLDQQHLLDFGDLIAKAVYLLQANPDVRREVGQQYRHILVDEYQDVNRASGILLREIASSGAELWVVGDPRQSIYRFRGASEANIRMFLSDFPGAQVMSLERNYRSQPVVVSAVSTLAPQMSAGGGVTQDGAAQSRAGQSEAARSGAAFKPWETQRPDAGGQVMMEVAEDLDAECDGIAREIQRQHEAGVPYRQQAILCRSHTALARVAGGIERAGLPVLYLGDLFERPEIRDLLSLISLGAGDENGLLRVARFAEYNIPLRDVLTLIGLAQDDQPFLRVLASYRSQTSAKPGALSPQGWKGLKLLNQHLEGIYTGKTAWEMLVHYLFVRSDYLRATLADPSVQRQQERLAIYQFLQFAYEQRRKPSGANQDPKRVFLDYVRRLERLGEDSQLRTLPEWAEGIDAVRMSTVHASKGLEFDVVYLPQLGKGLFPSRRQPQACPPPDGLLPDDVSAEHDTEEECLFFVGMSRARDTLCLSRAKRYGSRNSNKSELLGKLEGVLSRSPDGPVSWSSGEGEQGRGGAREPGRKGERELGSKEEMASVTPPHPLSLTPTLPRSVYDVEELEQYDGCPRQYFYDQVLNLGARREISPYQKLRRCVRQVLEWVREQPAGATSDIAAAHQKLTELWGVHGPVGHAYEDFYLQSARQMLANALLTRPGSRGSAGASPYEVSLIHGRVRFTPDQIDLREDGTAVIQRLRGGRVRPTERDEPRYALYQRYAEDHAGSRGQAQTLIQALSLLTGEVQDISLGESTVTSRLEKYDAAMAGIRAEQFAPTPNDRMCPRCPFYFICPKAEEEV